MNKLSPHVIANTLPRAHFFVFFQHKKKFYKEQRHLKHGIVHVETKHSVQRKQERAFPLVTEHQKTIFEKVGVYDFQRCKSNFLFSF